MQCRDYKKLLIHYKMGELDNKKENLLAKHLKECETCREFQKEIKLLASVTEKLKKIEPYNEQKAESISLIMNRISRMKKPRLYKSNSRLKNEVSGIPITVFRYVLNSAAIFLLGLFIYQQIEIRKDIDQLKLKFKSSKTYSQGNCNLSSTMDYKSLIEAYFNLEDKNFSNEQLLELLEQHTALLKENTAILEYLMENYPGVYEEFKVAVNDNEMPIHKL
jgi:hypothetical protein